MSDPQEQRDLQLIRNEVSFGMDCEAFMASPIGRYLTGRANTDRDAALDALGAVDAEDAAAIRTLQNKVKAAECFLLWMAEAVSAGEQAARTFVEQDN